MEIKLKRVEGLQFDAVSGEGHTIRIDGPPKIGGTDTGPRPMELVLMVCFLIYFLFKIICRRVRSW